MDYSHNDLVGFVIGKVIPFKIPVVIWVSIIALLVTSGIFPGHEMNCYQTAKINFMALASSYFSLCRFIIWERLKRV